MKNNRRILVAIFVLLFGLILVACEKPADESSEASENPTKNDNSSQHTEDVESPEVDSTDESSNEGNNQIDTGESDIDQSETNDKEINSEDKTDDNVTDLPAKEESSTNEIKVSLTEEYRQKLAATKKETDQLKATDSSTYALKKVENDRWEMWDGLLNEIYGVLEEQLAPDEMELLRAEQRGWIKYRDESALKASEKYKGGTQEHLEYVAVLAKLTEERCFELVEDYMK